MGIDELDRKDRPRCQGQSDGFWDQLELNFDHGARGEPLSEAPQSTTNLAESGGHVL